MIIAKQIVTAPVLEPLTLDETKSALRLETDFEVEDVFIKRLIKAARMYCENFLARALITQTWAVWLDEFPDSDEPIHLPFPPLISVTHLKYVDTAGAKQTWTATNYIAQTPQEPGQLILAYGIAWVAIRSITNTDAEMVGGPIRVQFVCGYGAAGSTVPEDIRTAMHMLIGHWYANREAFSAGEVSEAVKDAVHGTLWPYRIFEF